MKIVFATNNQNKLNEIQKLVPSGIEIQSLNDIQCFDDIPETGATLKENAQQKTNYIRERYDVNCFSDDTGLEIDALNGEPGVFSARYAGEQKDSNDNMALVLEKMLDAKVRTARFKTVISLFLEGKQYFFEGVCEGIIRQEKSGSKGFGYDPIFQPNGYTLTFAEMSMEEKNKISHRGLAVQKLIEFLKKY
ncbi:MAG: non-canonical purine NTP diphosphatase [Crocinitomicaceae bacterium]|nr:non-canonical purine NTP diphosphatase [Crocinitomicaceae bacterium]